MQNRRFRTLTTGISLLFAVVFAVTSTGCVGSGSGSSQSRGSNESQEETRRRLENRRRKELNVGPQLAKLQQRLDKTIPTSNPEPSAISKQIAAMIEQETDIAVLQDFADQFPLSEQAEHANLRVMAILDKETSVDRLLTFQTEFTNAQLQTKITRTLTSAIATDRSLDDLSRAFHRNTDLQTKSLLEERIHKVISEETSLDHLLAVQGTYNSANLEQKIDVQIPAVVNTATDLEALERSYKRITAPRLRSLIEERIAALIPRSSDFSLLANWACATNLICQNAANERAASLLSGSSSPDKTPSLGPLLVGALHTTRQHSSLAAVYLKWVHLLIAFQFEPITDEDYVKVFSLEGKTAGEIVDLTKRNLGLDLKFGSVIRLAFSQEESTLKTSISSLPVKGIDTLMYQGISYKRQVFADGKTVWEVISRESSASAQVVQTESLLLDGIRYRKSSVRTRQ